ncbi:MAG: molybdopterin-guanine dinucleotide biosynthesis protein B [Candidatus Hodarchaeota archaeon]
MRVFAISGFSMSGKTTLVERIVRELVKRGYTVSTIKSSKEDILAPSGTDTRKHLDAGASFTVLLGPQSTAIRSRRRLPIRKIVNSIDADFLIIEGMKNLDIPRFWCLGKEMQMPERSDFVKAYVAWPGSDISIADSRTILTSDEIEDLTSIVEREAVDFLTLKV